MRKKYKSLSTIFILLLLLIFVVTACGNQSNSDNDLEEAETASGAVSNLQDVRNTIVQIVATGSFKDIEQGAQTNTAGAGSGFIINPAGIAVTNNHVVTGSSFLEVYIQGEDEPRSAKILGVSECSDLAVIDIEGEGFPYLEWYDGEIEVGLDVYAAGYPLGDPEFTLTRGIISKENANGDTPWASVDAVLEHDATINLGNSGGPLLDENGQVVGVNYAGSSTTNQYFAISKIEVLDVIDILSDGEDVDSLGMNAVALTSKINGGFGIWVNSVDPGSPANKAGIEAGDIILSLQDFQLTDVPTMAEYCKIVRSHSANDTLSVEVLRIGDEEITLFEGQLNGDELEETVVLPLDLFSDEETVVDTSSSEAASATSALYNVNLILNPGNEEPLENGEIPYWEEIAGVNWGRNAEVPVYDGNAYFDAGEAGEYAELAQFVDLTGYAAAIDAGKQQFSVEVFMRSYPPQPFVPVDATQFGISFLDSDDEVIDSIITDQYFVTDRWLKYAETITAPPGTRFVAVRLGSIKYGGYDSDGFFDNVSLVALPPE